MIELDTVFTSTMALGERVTVGHDFSNLGPIEVRTGSHSIFTNGYDDVVICKKKKKKSQVIIQIGQLSSTSPDFGLLQCAAQSQSSHECRAAWTLWMQDYILYNVFWCCTCNPF